MSDLLAAAKGKVHVHTLLDALNEMAMVPERKTDAPLRLPISGAYKIKGVGDVLAGRVEQGVVKPGDEVIFLPTHTTANPCVGKVFTVEMHHKRVEKAGPGDNVGMNIKGLDKGNMPRTGDVMILKSDATLKPCSDFTAQIQARAFVPAIVSRLAGGRGLFEPTCCEPIHATASCPPANPLSPRPSLTVPVSADAGHPWRGEGWLLADWLRALRSRRLPHEDRELEGGQGDWRQEAGGR
jgi:hypothetical protein